MKITKKQLLEMIEEELGTLTELSDFPDADKPLSQTELFNAYMHLILNFTSVVYQKKWL